MNIHHLQELPELGFEKLGNTTITIVVFPIQNMKKMDSVDRVKSRRIVLMIRLFLWQ